MSLDFNCKSIGLGLFSFQYLCDCQDHHKDANEQPRVGARAIHGVMVGWSVEKVRFLILSIDLNCRSIGLCLFSFQYLCDGEDHHNDTDEQPLVDARAIESVVMGRLKEIVRSLNFVCGV